MRELMDDMRELQYGVEGKAANLRTYAVDDAGHGGADGVENFLRIVTPTHRHEYVINLWGRARRKIGSWLQGQVLLGVLIGVSVGAGAVGVGVDVGDISVGVSVGSGVGVSTGSATSVNATVVAHAPADSSTVCGGGNRYPPSCTVTSCVPYPASVTV